MIILNKSQGGIYMENKINIIYWSGTGNTEAMAKAIYEGSKKSENSKLIYVDKATIEDVKEADILFLGCPSMGVEELEEDSMEPFMNSISDDINGKKIILFGSYGWGDQSWMRDWESRVETDGAVLVSQGVTCMNEPDDTALEECRNLGASLS